MKGGGFVLVVLSLGVILSKSESGSARKSRAIRRSRVEEDALGSSESSQVYYGIPLLYQQRQELARDLGVDPIVTMSDFLFREHHPLFPEGFFNNHMEDHPSDNSVHHVHDDERAARKKRGIISNKIKKIKKGISSAKKKIWKIKERAISIVKGPNKNTPRPQYESTGGSWGEPASTPQGWSSRSNNREMYSSNKSPATYGSGYGSGEYGVSGPVGRHSAATVQVGWAKTYSPTDGLSARSNHGNGNIEGIHLTYGPPSYNKPEPNYKGLAVRSRISPTY